MGSPGSCPLLGTLWRGAEVETELELRHDLEHGLVPQRLEVRATIITGVEMLPNESALQSTEFGSKRAPPSDERRRDVPVHTLDSLVYRFLECLGGTAAVLAIREVSTEALFFALIEQPSEMCREVLDAPGVQVGGRQGD